MAIRSRNLLVLALLSAAGAGAVLQWAGSSILRDVRANRAAAGHLRVEDDGGKQTALRFILQAEFDAGMQSTIVTLKLPPDIEGVQQFRMTRLSDPKAVIFEDGSNRYCQAVLAPTDTPLTIDFQAELKAPISFAAAHKFVNGMQSASGEFDPRWLIQDRWAGPYPPQIVELARGYHGTEAEEVSRWAVSLCRKSLRPVDNRQDIDIREALQRGEGDCSEYTDLFVSLCRVRGVAARPCVGFAALGGGPFAEHAWAEVYDRRLRCWITVDPSWAAAPGGEYDRLYGDYIANGHERNDPLLYGFPNAGFYCTVGTPRVSTKLIQLDQR